MIVDGKLKNQSFNEIHKSNDEEVSIANLRATISINSWFPSWTRRALKVQNRFIIARIPRWATKNCMAWSIPSSAVTRISQPLRYESVRLTVTPQHYSWATIFWFLLQNWVEIYTIFNAQMYKTQLIKATINKISTVALSPQFCIPSIKCSCFLLQHIILSNTKALKIRELTYLS